MVLRTLYKNLPLLFMCLLGGSLHKTTVCLVWYYIGLVIWSRYLDYTGRGGGGGERGNIGLSVSVLGLSSRDWQ